MRKIGWYDTDKAGWVDMANEKRKPLYEKLDSQSDVYICSGTGNICIKVTKHFKEFHAFVDGLSKRSENRTFITSESNLCIGCPVWNNLMQRIAEKAKEKVR